MRGGSGGDISNHYGPRIHVCRYRKIIADSINIDITANKT